MRLTLATVCSLLLVDPGQLCSDGLVEWSPFLERWNPLVETYDDSKDYDDAKKECVDQQRSLAKLSDDAADSKTANYIRDVIEVKTQYWVDACGHADGKFVWDGSQTEIVPECSAEVISKDYCLTIEIESRSNKTIKFNCQPKTRSFLYLCVRG